MTQNVYIHVPFCKQKCKYCSFISFSQLSMKENYLACLEKEIKSRYKNEKLKTLYFGGGTPSLLTVNEFKKIINLFDIDYKTEITVEINPETVNYEYLYDLIKIGVNRLSIGCQTFDDNILKLIGRKHTAQQVIETVNAAKVAGFCNINIDFIYGLPKQTILSFETDLKAAIDLGIQHVSLYGLKIDQGCYFYDNFPDDLPDENMQAQMYLKAIDILTKNGFNHYEISNFSVPNYESVHNLNYWNNNTYYGFGVAAHGYIDGKRYSNTDILEKYLEKPLVVESEKILTRQEMLEEEIFLGLRRLCGIDIMQINKKYGIDFEDKYEKVLKKYLYTGHMVRENTNYKLSVDGILVSNYILADFLD